MRRTVLVVLVSLALVLGFSAVSAAAGTQKSYRVTLNSSVFTSQVGKFITLSGRVFGPRNAGKKVIIQRHYVGTRWRNVAVAVTNSEGRFKTRLESAQGGTTSYRAIKPRSSVRRAGISPTRNLAVYKWLYLASEGHVSSPARVYFGIEQVLNGVNYKRSIAWYDGDSSVSYRLDGLCTVFTGVAGYRFEGDAGVPDDLLMTIQRVQTNGPGIQTQSDRQTGTSSRATVPLAGTRFLNLEFSSVNDQYIAAFGDPKAYCNADRLPSFTISDFI